MKECKHKWMFKQIEAVYGGYEGASRYKYKDYDTYFCEKCLEQKAIPKSDWYFSGKDDINLKGKTVQL